MGTRSTTKIYNQWGRLVLSLYKQFDGYHSGWGTDLKNFIKRGTFVNGIPSGLEVEENCLHNGIEDFALNLVKEFKQGAGGLYATTENDEQEYNYKIEFKALEGGAFSIKISSDRDFNETFVTDNTGKVIS